MKRVFSLAASLALLCAVSATAVGQAVPAAQGRKKRIAIMDFDYATVHSGVAGIFGQDVDIGKGISDLLVTDLVKDGTYSIIERKALDKIMAEQNFSNSDRANPTSAAKLGKLLGVDAILVGSITEFGDETKNTGVGGGGGNWHGFGNGNVDFGSSDFQNTIIGEAVKAATDQLSTEVVADSPKLVARTIVVEGLVAAVDSGQIILNVGTKAGVKVGDQLNVERVTREIKDPATGKVIHRMTASVGVVRVTDVDDLSSVCSAVSGSGFKVGDMVKTVTQ